jgi:hypothetical protein
MADTLELFRLLCNGSVRLESRTERLTGDAEFLLLREGLDHTAVIDLLALRLEDPRDPSLLHANVAVIAQGCGDQNDAAAFRCKSWTLPDGDRAHRRDAESQSPCPTASMPGRPPSSCASPSPPPLRTSNQSFTTLPDAVSSRRTTAASTS